jgi:hypothetical protein
MVNVSARAVMNNTIAIFFIKPPSGTSLHLWIVSI